MYNVYKSCWHKSILANYERPTDPIFANVEPAWQLKIPLTLERLVKKSLSNFVVHYIDFATYPWTCTWPTQSNVLVETNKST